MTMTRTLTTSAFLWTATLGSALAQQTNPAPPIPETGPAGSNSAAANAAAARVRTDRDHAVDLMRYYEGLVAEKAQRYPAWFAK